MAFIFLNLKCSCDLTSEQIVVFLSEYLKLQAAFERNSVICLVSLSDDLHS